MADNICSFCNSTWNTSKVLTECPFCGKTILIENDDNNEQFDMTGLLIKMRDTYGVDIFKNKNQAISIMKDFAPYLEHEIRLLKLGLEANVYLNFIKIQSGELNQSEVFNRVNSVLVDDYFLNEKSVGIIIEWFSILFSIKTAETTTNNQKKSIIPSSTKEELHKNTAVVIDKQAKLASETTKESLSIIEKLHDIKGHCIYEGYTKKGKRHGTGTSFFENGTKEYDGEWYSDVKSGIGTLYNRSGVIVYSGEWLNGCMHGRGELHSYDGVYVGSFANDKKNGKGLMKYKDGREEQQEWHYGTRVIDETLFKAFMNLYTSFDENYVKTNYNLILEFANKGNSDALFFIGKCYDKGIAVKEDKVEANRWYKKAAEKGNSCAVHNLGSLLESQGPAYSSQAIDYFKKALKQGEMLAAWNLGRMYLLRWKSNPDINWAINADTFLSEGLALKKPNQYTTEKMFLKYKYECAAMAHRTAKLIVGYFEKKSKSIFGKTNNYSDQCVLYTDKIKAYDSIMAEIKTEMLTKYRTDVTKMDW